MACAITYWLSLLSPFWAQLPFPIRRLLEAAEDSVVAGVSMAAVAGSVAAAFMGQASAVLAFVPAALRMSAIPLLIPARVAWRWVEESIIEAGMGRAQPMVPQRWARLQPAPRTTATITIGVATVMPMAIGSAPTSMDIRLTERRRAFV